MQQDPYNTHPYDSQSYDSPALPYIPYASPIENTSHSYNASESASSSAVYSPLVYESTPLHTQTPATNPQPGISVPLPEPLVASVPRKRKRPLWISIGVFILITLVVATSTFALASYLNRSTPTKTLDTFCTALQDGKYQTAYDQFTPTMQMNFTENQFAMLLSSDSVATCKHGNASENGTSTTTDLHLLHKKSKGTNNDKVILTKDNQSQWKINDIHKA